MPMRFVKPFWIVLMAVLFLFTAFPANVNIANAADKQAVNTETTIEVNATVDTNTTDQKLISSANIQKEEAVEIAKKYIKNLDEYKLNSINSYTDYEKRLIWDMYWIKEVEGNPVSNIQISVDSEKGQIISYNFYNYSQTPAQFPAKITVEEAKKIADDYIKEIFPDLLGKIEADDHFLKSFKAPLSGPTYYQIPYRYLINGVPFEDNKIYVQVSGDGEVTSFNYYSFDDVEFENTEGTISVEEAKEKYVEQLDENLLWVFPYNQYEANIVPFLTYQASIQSHNIDAKTGELYYYPGQTKVNIDYQPISDKPLADPPKDNGQELTQEQVLEIAKSYLRNFFAKVPEIENINYYSNDYLTKHGMWSLSWQNKDNSLRTYYGNMTIDAVTGELINFYKDDYSQDEAEKENILTYDEAKKLAVDTIKKFVPSKAHEVYLLESINANELKDQKRIYFNFQRLVQGIPTERESITVSVNLVTGLVFNYGMNWGTVDYPDQLPTVIDMEKAKELILGDMDLELVYIAPYPSYPDTEGKRQGVLIYKPKNSYTSVPIFLDAVSGQWRSREDGDLINQAKPEDIEGHWAEKELLLMVDYKALDLIDGKVLPNKNITRGELVKMFIMATGGGRYYPYVENKEPTFSDVTKESPYYAYIEDAVSRNLISADQGKKFNPEQEVTREELAQFIVNALGYDKLAYTDQLFINPYHDVTDSKYTGHIAIVSALKIMTGSNGGFNPKKYVNRAEIAVAFYRFLGIKSQYIDGRPPIYY